MLGVGGSRHHGALLATLESKGAGTRNGGAGRLNVPAGNTPRKGRGWCGQGGGDGPWQLSRLHVTVAPGVHVSNQAAGLGSRETGTSKHTTVVSRAATFPRGKTPSSTCAAKSGSRFTQKGRREPPTLSVLLLPALSLQCQNGTYKAYLRTDLWAEGRGLLFSVADVSEHLLQEQANRSWWQINLRFA